MSKNLVIGFLAIVAVVGLFLPMGGKSTIERVVGAPSGPTHTERQEFLGGVMYGNNVASSSLTTATVSAAEFASWVNADVVILSPGGAVGNKTVTFPASSTVPSLLPQAGDYTRTCFFNATTSASNIIFAAGTGIDIEVSSSTPGATIATTMLTPGEIGCFDFIRQAQLAATFDIAALFTLFQDAD